MRPGDSLSGIAKHFGISIYNLARDNHMQLYDVLLVGKVLHLPLVRESPAPAMSWMGPARTWTASPHPPGSAPSPPVTHVAVVVASSSGVWGCIAMHESGANPAENTGNGYYGEYQFAPSTWQTMMVQMYGKNAPYQSYPYAAAAPSGVQLAAAEHLQAEAGWGQWPRSSVACGV